MPGLEFTNMPVVRQRESPFTIVENQLRDLVQVTQRQENNLRRSSMSKQQFAGEINQLQGQYDAKKNRILGIRKNMELVKNLVAQGTITQEAGDEAMWKLALPDEVQRAMFQTPVNLGTPIKPDSKEQNTLLTMIDEYTSPEVIQEGAGGWFRSKKPIQGALLNQYAKFRNEVGYKALTPIVQKQIDDMWDNVQAERKLENDSWDWDPKSREIQMMRPYGPLQEAMSDRISPFGRSVVKNKPKSGVLSESFKYGVATAIGGPVGQTVYAINRIASAIPKKSITATNPKTGERIISYDGGKSWSPVR